MSLTEILGRLQSEQEDPAPVQSNTEPQFGLRAALYQNSLMQRKAEAQRAANVRKDVTDFMGYGPDWRTYLQNMNINLQAQLPQLTDSGEQMAQKGLGIVGNFGAFGMTKMVKPLTDDFLTIYRGEYAGNKGGKFWSPDQEFARQFTQSGQDKEILKQQIRRSEVMDVSSKVYAGDPDALEAAVKEAHKNGFRAVMVNEGIGQPNSIYWFGSDPKLPF